MNPKVIFSVCLVLTTLAVCSGRAATNQAIGKYKVSKTFDDGKYKPVKRNQGGYLHMVEPYKHIVQPYQHTVQPYVHIHDNRELGQYRHVHNPYGGGYGPYAGLHNPYEHDDTGTYRTVSNADFVIPAIRLEYGFPEFEAQGVEKQVEACDIETPISDNLIDNPDETPPPPPTTTTRRTTTTTTTTVKPRVFNYYDEGGWKILRQEEEKKKHKYDYLYLTENGIYGEEKAHLRQGAGTAASGFYEYTGDDGELYRVNYKSDERGFIPEADHIPTPPPIPDAIKRALEYVAKKKEQHGEVQTGQYEHKPGPDRLQNMPTNERPLNAYGQFASKPNVALPTLGPFPAFGPQQNLSPLQSFGPRPNQSPLPTTAPRPTYGSHPTIPPRPTLAPLPILSPVPTVAAPARFAQYDAENNYKPLPTGLGSIASQTEQPEQYQSQTVAPYVSEQELVAEQQIDAVQQGTEQPEQTEQPQLYQRDEQPQADQSADTAVFTAQEQQASEQRSEIQSAYQPQADQSADTAVFAAQEPQASEQRSEIQSPYQPEITESPQATEQPGQTEQPQLIQQDEQPQADQSADAAVVAVQEQPVAQASEQVAEFQPPYQVPEELTNKENYEDTTA